MTKIEPILDSGLDEVCEFVRRGLQSAETIDHWRHGFRTDWCTDKPNYGFQLRVDGKLAGALFAIYSIQMVGGHAERFCNATGWFVEPEHRRHSLSLLAQLTAQPNFHFTNFTPSPTVAGILPLAGFRRLPPEILAIPNLPFGRWRRAEVHDRPEAIGRVLEEGRRKVATDHLACPGVFQLAAGSAADGYCHVIFRRGKCRGLPTAVVHDVSDPQLFGRVWPAIAAFYLRRGLVTTRVRTLSMDGCRIPLSRELTDRQQLFFRSATLGPESIRTIYSELMMFGDQGE